MNTLEGDTNFLNLDKNILRLQIINYIFKYKYFLQILIDQKPIKDVWVMNKIFDIGSLGPEWPDPFKELYTALKQSIPKSNTVGTKVEMAVIPWGLRNSKQRNNQF